MDRVPAVRGREQIGRYPAQIADEPVTLALGDEIVAQDRAAFSVVADLDDGRRIVENCIVDLRDGLVVRQVDVEAWDP